MSGRLRYTPEEYPAALSGLRQLKRLTPKAVAEATGYLERRIKAFESGRIKPTDEEFSRIWNFLIGEDERETTSA
jgi:hypothetical protein